MNRLETALNTFKSGYNCAQSVLVSQADRLGLSRDSALKAASGFGGGMGRKQQVCGAVTGGILVLGLRFGRGEQDGGERQEAAYGKVGELMEGFQGMFGTVSCRELLDGCNLLTPEGQKRFAGEKMILRCHGFVEYVVKMLEEQAE